METPEGAEPLIERMKAWRPRRAVRRRLVQALFGAVTLLLLAEAAGALLRLAGVPLVFAG